MMPIAAGLAGIAGGKDSAKYAAGASRTVTAPTPNGFADTAAPEVASLDAGVAPAAAPAASADNTPAKDEAAKKAAVPAAELFTNFGSLGPVTGGDDYDVRMAQTKAQRTYVPKTSGTGASSEEEPGVTIAAGETNVPRAPAAHDSAAPSKPTPTTDVAALREALRKRLAERTQHGGDADASAAVDDLLYAGQERKPASATGLAEEARAEQAGPQARDSEPLFQRVHHAHRRFQSRAFPHNAGL
jgi:hypothetical protein